MSKFNQERRDMLKSTCVLVGGAALYTIGGSLKAFAAGGRGAQPQPLGAPERHDSFVYFDGPKKGQDVMTADIALDAPPITVQAKDPETGKVRDSEKALVLVYRTSPDKIATSIKGDTWNGIVAYSALCTGEGAQITGWDASAKQFICTTCKSAFDPLQGGPDKSGRGARDLPQIPVGDHGGKLIVSDAILSWIGVKRKA